MAVATTYALENSCLPGSTIEKAENLFLNAVINYVTEKILKSLSKIRQPESSYVSRCIPIGNSTCYWCFDQPLDDLFCEKMQKLPRQKILSQFSDLCETNPEITAQAVISLFSSDPFVRLSFDFEWLVKIREQVYKKVWQDSKIS